MSTRPTAALLAATEQVLGLLLDFAQPADAVLSNYFRNHRQAGPRERAFIAECAYAVLRHKRTLDLLCSPQITPRRLLLAVLVRLQGYSQRQLDELLTRGEVQWLADMKAVSDAGRSVAERADLPDWLAQRLLAVMDEADLLALARGLNQPAPLDLRVNTLKAERAAVLAQLQAEGIAVEACPYAPQGLRLSGRMALARHPLFLSGALEVQDEGSQLLGHLVAPKRGEMVVDFCAGAGGKTLLLGAMMRSSGRLYAFDVSDKRLARLKPRLARSGLSNVHPAVISGENDAHVKRLSGKIDRVLVDAPCSGLGTLRRNPDLKWRQTPEGVEELTRKQAAILAAAARLLKVGGRIVYATCSLLDEENEAIVETFLAAHGNFGKISCAEILAKQDIALDTGEDLKLLPHVHGTDGFYAAVMERRE